MVSFLVTLLILSLIVFICIGRTFVHKERIALPLRKLLFTVILPLISNVVIALSPSQLVCQIAYMGYFIGTDWLLLYMVNFTRDFCSFRQNHAVINGILVVLGLADTLSILLNPFFGHVFTLKELMLPTGVYISYVSELAHYPHLAYTVLLVLDIIILFIMKMVKVSRFYIEKYLVVLACVIVVVLWEAYYIVSRTPVDFSMIGYCAGAILCYFFSIEYKPIFLTDRMLSQIVEDISDAIFFVDDLGNCIYFNQGAAKLFNLERYDYIGAKSIISVLGEAEFFGLEESSDTRTFYDGEKESTLEIEYHKMYDKRRIYAGSFISIHDRTDEVARLAKQHFEATHDKLTGLFNKDYFGQKAETLLKGSKDTTYVLVCSDIEDFKFINDTFGKDIGDRILKAIAELIEYFAMDDGAVYGRIGLDRFAVLMPQYRYSEELFVSGIKRLAHFDKEIFYPVIIRIGVYEVKDRTLSVAEMEERALLASASLKNTKKSEVAYYTEDMYQKIMWERKISEQLSPALDSGLIIPYLQAQVRRDGSVEGAEVLCRWDNTPSGVLTPDNFLEILEKNDSIVRLDFFIWESACKILQRWKYKGRDDFYLSVNISVKDFFYIDVYDTITSLVRKYDISPRLLRLEITETAMMTDLQHNISVIDRLRQAGFTVEMDDFGSGYSSLNMLKELPVDILKIDMVFLSETENPERARTILKCVVAMANELKIPVIMEGVENVDQLDFLRSIGCDMFQGFYFSRPASLKDFEEIYFKA